MPHKPLNLVINRTSVKYKFKIPSKSISLSWATYSTFWPNPAFTSVIDPSLFTNFTFTNFFALLKKPRNNKRYNIYIYYNILFNLWKNTLDLLKLVKTRIKISGDVQLANSIMTRNLLFATCAMKINTFIKPQVFKSLSNHSKQINRL